MVFVDINPVLEVIVFKLVPINPAFETPACVFVPTIVVKEAIDACRVAIDYCKAATSTLLPPSGGVFVYEYPNVFASKIYSYSNKG